MYSYKRRRIMRQILVFHFIPVSINFMLLGLYIRRVLWTPPWPTTNILNTLQLAAKVHETLMIASLASVLLHHIRYRLLADGVPLGLVTSPFRLLDLTYLWSQEFLAAWSGEEGDRRLLSIFIHVFLFVLAAVLGPASAISMLPRSREWELADSMAKVPFGGIGLETYIGGQLSDIYPLKITASFNPKACNYGNLSQLQSNSCPRLGLEDILQEHLGTDVDTGPFDPEEDTSEWGVGFNFTVQRNGNSAVRPRDIEVEFKANLAGNREIITDVTTPPDLYRASCSIFLVIIRGLGLLMARMHGWESAMDLSPQETGQPNLSYTLDDWNPGVRRLLGNNLSPRWHAQGKRTGTIHPDPL